MLDAHGDELVSATLPGDGWRSVHDELKEEVAELCRWAGLKAETEVLNLVSHLSLGGVC